MKSLKDDQIVIRLPDLLGLNLTPNQYVYLAILEAQGDIVAKMFVSLTQEDYKHLMSLDYLTYDNQTRCQILDKGKKIFEVKVSEDLFSELYKAFPRKVSDGKGGYRILRADSLESKDAEVCRKKYSLIIKEDKKLHKKILGALKTELRMKKNSLQYMNNLETWLNQRIYEKYLGFDEDSIDDNSEKTTLI